jgi:hypothetical protein
MSRPSGWLTALWLSGVVLSALDGSAQERFPRVYGPTGRPYGPTQAHYQYERQYGRPWHGYGGQAYSGPREHHIVVPYGGAPVLYGGGVLGGGVFGGPYVGGAYGPWGVIAPPVAVVPGLTFGGPATYGGFGLYGTPGYVLPYADHALAAGLQPLSDPLGDLQRENEARWGRNLPDLPPDPVTRPVAPTTAAARLRCLEAQSRGDAHLRKQEWSQAFADYRVAMEAAPDQGAPHLRLALTSLMQRRYATAIPHFQRAYHLDPELLTTAPALTDLFGEENNLAVVAMQQQLIDHVQADIRDPDRLYLLGVMLHLIGDPRSREMFEIGFRLETGRGDHFAVFLRPTATANHAPDANVPELPPPPQP